MKREQWAEMIADRDREIERLRHENMRLQTANEYAFGPKGELANKEREIERLRTEVLRLEGSECDCPAIQQADEIERLRAAIRKYLSHQLSQAESYKVLRAALGHQGDAPDV